MTSISICVRCRRLARYIVQSCASIFLCVAVAAILIPSASFAAITIRVVSWNINADNSAPAGTHNGIGYGGSTNGIPAAGAALETVLEAIGQEGPVNAMHAIDVLALQELYKMPSITLNSIVTQLNATYGAGTYAYDPTVDPVDGSGTQGNGPNGLIYNTRTIQVKAVAIIGTPSGSGQARAPSAIPFSRSAMARRPRSTSMSSTPRAAPTPAGPPPTASVATSKSRASARMPMR